jgi:hypothetical protein
MFQRHLTNNLCLTEPIKTHFRGTDQRIVTCSTEGRRCYATRLSLLRNRGRTVPWIRSHSVLSRCMVTNSE